MLLGWKTLLRAVFLTAAAATVMFAPAYAARRANHNIPSVSKPLVKKTVKMAEPAKKSKSTKHSVKENIKDYRNASEKRKPLKDKKHSRKNTEQETQDIQHRERKRRPSTSNKEERHNTRSRNQRRMSRSSPLKRKYVDDMVEHVVGKKSHGYTQRATDIAMTAMSLIGTPYRYGGNDPLTGLDCSGFVRHVYKETLGTSLPRTAAEMSQVGQWVSRDELKPGDLVFYNTMRRSNSHVGIYLGDDKFIHSPRTGQHVRIDNMNESYWRGRFNGARRVIRGEGIDKKVFSPYSQNADTAPDTYDYDTPDRQEEKNRRRFTKSRQNLKIKSQETESKRPRSKQAVTDREGLQHTQQSRRRRLNHSNKESSYHKNTSTAEIKKGSRSKLHEKAKYSEIAGQKQILRKGKDTQILKNKEDRSLRRAERKTTKPAQHVDKPTKIDKTSALKERKSSKSSKKMPLKSGKKH